MHSKVVAAVLGKYFPWKRSKTVRRKIVQAGDPGLRAQARRLTHQEIISDEIQRLIRDMRETMQDVGISGKASRFVKPSKT